jgi:restriction system protein
MNYHQLFTQESNGGRGDKRGWYKESWAKTYQAYAILKSAEAKDALLRLDSILLSALNVNYGNIWDNILKEVEFKVQKPVRVDFDTPCPTKIKFSPIRHKFLNRKNKKFDLTELVEPVMMSLEELPPEPDMSDAKYRSKLHFLQKIFFGKKELQDINLVFLTDSDKWSKENQRIFEKNKQKQDDYEDRLNRWEINKVKYEEQLKEHDELYNRSVVDWNENRIEHDKEQELLLKNWETAKLKYENDQKEFIDRTKKIISEYSISAPNSIEQYTDLVLSVSIYPDYFPRKLNLEYKQVVRTLVVDYALPNIESLPKIKKINYVISRNEFNETLMSSSALNKIYDNLLYQIALRTIFEIFKTDDSNKIDSIVFNGWVDSINKATGKNTNSCIMSIQSSKDEFTTINLDNVDPKECFKHLKGVGSSKLHGLAAVAPIVSISREDNRFVDSYSVVGGVDDSENLAAMDWQDFENLIREIFEKEFVSYGGEVKITQASRDGGVDAIAFDPDPIRGGKIVIQAKRYTNVVGVSAVRDLYGTVMNEGATKGILVTTADYGPEAYQFAKDKPLALLNGSNLLHLLEKHGHSAKIDIREAKKILANTK